MRQVTSDPADDMFVECADAARADYLITGNQRHFPAFWKNTKIITSSEFLSIIAPPNRACLNWFSTSARSFARRTIWCRRTIKACKLKEIG